MNNTTHLDGEAFKELLLGGLSNLKIHAKEVDELNVFPVPDGDTGTNMSMTLQGGVNAIQDSYFESVSEFAKAFSRGALLGARGNSGVILSQFIKGLALGFDGCKTITLLDFYRAFREGVVKAYDAVLNPTEGTMLTVMREGAEFLEVFLKDKPNSCFEETLESLNVSMQGSLDRTPDLLPVLKEAGVIDSGGAGFLYIFRGVEMALKGEEITAEQLHPHGHALSMPAVDFSAFTSDSELEFGYCTEFILQLQKSKVDVTAFDKQTIVDYLEQVGDSIVAVQDDDIIKIHVHTFKPGDVLNYCQQFGEYITLKIENMSVQHNEIMLEEERKTKNKIKKPIAIVAALSGDGLKKYFQEIGVDVIVDGGQTDNPSTEDFLQAFEKIEAEHIIVLPCNSNIVMASSQAAEIYKDAKVHIVKAKTIAEGYAALSMMNLSLEIEDVIRDMEQAIDETETGMITTSIRDVDYENLSVKKGQFIGLNKDAVLSASDNKIDAARDLIAATEGLEEKAVIVAFYGANVSADELGEMERMLKADFPLLEYGFIEGGQEVYDFIFAIE